MRRHTDQTDNRQKYTPCLLAKERGRDAARPEMSVALCAILPDAQRDAPLKGIPLQRTTDTEHESFYRFCAEQGLAG